ncbi:hypothetical protein GCM10010231_63450 [Streptomyces sindenensis]|nr:hypothetical protein GCM10010231_63450 [Streptomyces sindenensis]
MGCAPSTQPCVLTSPRTWKASLELLSKAPEDRPAYTGAGRRRLATWLPERGDPTATLTPWAEIDPLRPSGARCTSGPPMSRTLTTGAAGLMPAPTTCAAAGCFKPHPEAHRND